MGWGDPWVITALFCGILLLVAFPIIETRVEDPMFRMDLFKIRNFAFGNAAGFISALARGGVMIVLIILLQGIWLPLHGYSFESTPFWARVFMLPLTIGFVVMGPLSGIISDKYGARWISTLGMVLVGIAFLILAILPYNLEYLPFALALLIMGLGNGMFSSPNAAAIMNSVPPEERGVTSGMMSTLVNSGFVLSMGMFFTIIVVGLTGAFPPMLSTALSAANATPLVPAMSAVALAAGSAVESMGGNAPVVHDDNRKEHPHGKGSTTRVHGTGPYPWFRPRISNSRSVRRRKHPVTETQVMRGATRRAGPRL